MNKIFFHPTYLYWRAKLEQLLPGKLSVLDYGCGNGILVDLLGQERFRKYKGLDPSRDAIKVGQLKYPKSLNMVFATIDPPNFPIIGKSNSYNLVIAIGVLQYMTDDEIEIFIRESQRVLIKGGKLMFSTVVDTPIYMSTNLYQLVFPNRYINRSKVIKILHKYGYTIEENYQRGLLFGPLISHGLVIPFDAIDHYLLGVKGRIGPLGQAIRFITFPLLFLELLLPIDYGYTWYLIAKK